MDESLFGRSSAFQVVCSMINFAKRKEQFIMISEIGELTHLVLYLLWL